MIKLLVNVKSKRPGCVILQAIAGCAENNHFMEMTFDTQDWIVDSMEDMHVINGTKEQWEKLAQLLRNKRLTPVNN